MKLQTQIPLKKAANQFDYNSQVLLLGSCFVENIGKKLAYFKFRSLQNPFGILYHPLALQRFSKAVLANKKFPSKHLIRINEKWQWLDAHSDLGRTTKEETSNTLDNAIQRSREWAKDCTHIILTLGTAWAYEYKPTKKIIANCHKLPKKEFEKVLVSKGKITTALLNTLNNLIKLAPKANIILTVSPVRHLKDGFVENQRSKANLVSAVHEIMDKRYIFPGFPPLSPRISYFESYELMMDELRDYRFYEKDMVHPNQLAIDYIWEKFNYVWISESAYPTMEKVDEVQKGLNHRPFNPDSDQHRKFEESIERKIEYLEREYPFMRFGNKAFEN